ncbi:MAG: hypothetical protein V5A20_05045 [Salinibacter sp.]|uniref:hypothetical protein n=1 Tax=Salinibacter sp. TaxID=2065818 RepID=UPI002FC3BCF1
MQSTTQSATQPTTAQRTAGQPLRRRVGPWDWVRGAFGGFVGSVAFGLFMAFIMPPPMLEVVIPNLYGIEATPQAPAPLAGWAFHQFHGVMLGLGYVAYVEAPAVADWIEPRTLNGGLVHGLLWGVLTTVAFPVLVMPLWLQAAGFGGAPPFPNVGFPATLLGLIGHLIYAVPLGLLYALYRKS